MKTTYQPEPGEKMGTDIEKIIPFLWMNDQAEEAAVFYTSVFKNSAIHTITHYGEAASKASLQPEGSVMSVGFQIEGQKFGAVNGGPVFKITPAISFFINCESPAEIDLLWNKLSEKGSILMELDRYPFSERYGWLKDRYGVTWQLSLSRASQKITPFFMFSGNQYGKAEEAIKFYISIFRNSGIINTDHYSEGDTGGKAGKVRLAKFFLNNQVFMAIDSEGDHNFTFTPGLSLVVNCDTQEELDYFWSKLCEGGDENAQQCGWLQDKYGISWQIVPSVWEEMLRNADPVKSNRLMTSILQMKKIDILTLKRVYEKS
jgi:predicted 3-demethylubiquinone-9 3-methyltransferase (glyoxalase superfamily)